MRLSRVVLLNGLGSMDATTSAGSGIFKTAKGFAELQRTLISGERIRKRKAKSGPGIPPGCNVVISKLMGRTQD
jgi:hypothetical protein